jgi:hypothetical protein
VGNVNRSARVSTFSVKAATKKKTDKRADKITMLEENNDHYHCMTVM